MKATDLMLGDWVKENGKICKVDELSLDNEISTNIHDLWDVSAKIEPIPITKKWVELNGWEKECSCYSKKLPSKYGIEILEPVTPTIIIVRDPNGFQIGCFKCKYIHELQNGIRLITKQDIELKFE